MLLQVPGDQFGHLEHADLLLAIEDDLQCGIRVDEGLLLGVLELVFLDVIPELLGEFGRETFFFVKILTNDKVIHSGC